MLFVATGADISIILREQGYGLLREKNSIASF
jgi:hypothetical protein